MTDRIDTAGLLNLSTAAHVPEASSLEAAALWCYRHDCGPMGPGGDPDWRLRPDGDAFLGFAKPHLEDYLRLLLKAPSRYDVAALAASLQLIMLTEVDSIDRHKSGEIVQDAWFAYASRFQRPQSATSSVGDEAYYPFEPFAIDYELIVSHPPLSYDDTRCQYLAEKFKSYFPKFCSVAEAARYPSYDDAAYIAHGSCVGDGLFAFTYSNASIPKDGRKKWGPELFPWVNWTAVLLRPRVAGEEF